MHPVDYDDVRKFIQVVQRFGQYRVEYDFGNYTLGIAPFALLYLAVDGADGF
jgi:hypothetical protein